MPPGKANNFQSAPQQRQSRRWLALFGFFVFAALLIFGRLVYIQVYAAEGLSEMAVELHKSPQKLHARRGTIYDRNSKVLAISVDTVSIYCYLPQSKDRVATAYCLTKVLGGEMQDWLDKITGLPNDNVSVCLVRYGDIKLQEDFEALNAELVRLFYPLEQLKNRIDPNGRTVWYATTPISCLDFVHEYRRVYPYGSIGSQVIGNVGADGHGICGLELQYDLLLSGQDGEVIVETGLDGTPLPNGIRSDSERPKIDGEDLVISIDIDLQDYVENELVRFAQLGNTTEGSATVVSAKTGEIYAAASLPLYNRETVTQEQIELGAMSLKNIVDRYEPGSTMKMVATAVALEEGVIGLDEYVTVPPNMEIDDFTIKDWYNHSTQDMNLAGIIANSSNIGMTLIGQRLDHQTLYDFYFQAGFYQPTHVDYTGLSGKGEPVYTTDEVDSLGRYYSIADKPWLWSDVHAANLTFGQGIDTTPLQMASYYGAIANKGVLVSPHFLIIRPQSEQPVMLRENVVMQPETTTVLIDLMEGVMTEGTGVYAAVPGYRIAGKTGTAEKSSGGSYSGEVVQSIVGFFIDTDCDLVCLVEMSDAGLVGNAVAPKPLFASIMEYIANRYRIEPNARQY